VKEGHMEHARPGLKKLIEKKEKNGTAVSRRMERSGDPAGKVGTGGSHLEK